MSRRSKPKLGWFRALARYYRDPSASTLGKLVVFAALIYAVVPIDLIPDVPVVGWLDDLGVMGLATAWLARVVSRYRDPQMLERSADNEQAPPSDASTESPRSEQAPPSGRGDWGSSRAARAHS